MPFFFFISRHTLPVKKQSHLLRPITKTVFFSRTQCHAADIAYCTPHICGYLAAHQDTFLKALEEAVTTLILLTNLVLKLLKFTTEFTDFFFEEAVTPRILLTKFQQIQ